MFEIIIGATGVVRIGLTTFVVTKALLGEFPCLETIGRKKPAF